jgi:hypothetical protein
MSQQGWYRQVPAFFLRAEGDISQLSDYQVRRGW